jgi:hypothetical protein
MTDRHPIGVTLINKINPQLVAAHMHKLDLTIVHQFESNHNADCRLAFSTSPVLATRPNCN